MLAHKQTALQLYSRSKLSIISFLIYLFATIVALFFLQTTLKVVHLSELGRAPEILLLASLMLGVTQSYGMTWALPSMTTANTEVTSFDQLWIAHIFRSLLRILITLGVCIHFLFSQSISFNEGSVAKVSDHNTFIEQTSYLITILGGWLFVTFGFFFLTERDATSKVKKHLLEISNDNYVYQSPSSESWGLWSFIVSTLNSFSESLAEKKNLETELIETSKFALLGEATGNLAHEIRNPMTVIKAHASRIKKLIEKGELQPEQFLKSAQSIDEMIIRQNKIIEGIREFTHSSDRAAFKTVFLSDLFKLVIEMTALKAEEFQVPITINDPDSKIAVSGNMIQLSQVFINLCSNAIDAIAEKLNHKIRRKRYGLRLETL